MERHHRHKNFTLVSDQYLWSAANHIAMLVFFKSTWTATQTTHTFPGKALREEKQLKVSICVKEVGNLQDAVLQCRNSLGTGSLYSGCMDTWAALTTQ